MKKVNIRYCKVWASYLPKAVRAAESIKKEFGIETELTEGDRGEFSVWVDDKKVAKKGWLLFPSNEKILESVGEALTT